MFTHAFSFRQDTPIYTPSLINCFTPGTHADISPVALVRSSTCNARAPAEFLAEIAGISFASKSFLTIRDGAQLSDNRCRYRIVVELIE
jgi:hypothetical protein